jgi:transcriptional regulator with XRE-family HTH domain
MSQSGGDSNLTEVFEVPAYVTARLRAGREQKGLSVRALARRLNVSASLISQIETGKANPSVGTLLAIVSALDISLDELFSDETTEQADSRPAAPGRGAVPAPGVPAGGIVLRAAERPSVDLSGGVRWERLTPTTDHEVSFLYVTYEVGGASSPPDALMQHAGREFGVVIEGQLGAQVGDETYHLWPGDSITLECPTPHRFWTIGDEPALVVWTILNHPTE